MQENKFEKEVHEKMEELSFPPSPALWQKVEEEIRKKGDRRRILIFLFPLLLLTGGVGIWLYTNSNAPKVEVAISTNNIVKEVTITNSKTENKTTNSVRSIQAPSHSNLKKINKTAAETNVVNNEILEVSEQQNYSTQQTKKIIEVGKGSEKSKIKNHLHNRALANKVNKNNNQAEQKKTPVKNTIVKNPTVRKEATVLNTEATNATVEITNEVTATPKVDTVTKVQTNDPKMEEATLNTDSVPPIKKAVVQDKKWQWGIVFNIGLSGEKSGLLGNADKSLNAFAAPGTTASAPPLGAQNPSTIKEGFSFSAGLAFKSKLGARTNFVSGIQYSYYSTNRMVGNGVRRDTAIRNAAANSIQLTNYFTNDRQTKEYKNHYHFLEMPLSIEYKLLKKLPLHVQGGVLLSYLVTTNGLMYNKASNIYYVDKNAFRKTGLQLMTGFNYEVAKKADKALLIGPQVRYGLNRLHKENVSSPHYLFFAGINTRFTF